MDGLKSLCSTQHLIWNLNGIKVVEWGNMQLGKHPTRLILVITPPYIRMGMITSSIISSSTSAEGSTPFYVTFPCAPLTGGAWSIASCHVPKPSLSPNSTVTPGPCCFCIAEMDSTGLLTSNPLLLSLSLSTLKVILSILY